jgi:hypothetical protein
VAGETDCGQITVSVAAGALTDSYTYDIIGDTGSIAYVHGMPGKSMPGYRLSGATEDGIFANSDFGGVDVSVWKDLQPLLGSFIQFNYRPNSLGLDMNAQVDLYVYGVTPELGSASSTPLPTSLMGGLAGVGMLGLYRWRCGRRTKHNG